MKRIFFSLLTMMMVAVVCVSFSSCSKNDDEQSDGSSNNGTASQTATAASAALVGTWFEVSYNGRENEGTVLVFNQDGTGLDSDYYDDGELDFSQPIKWSYNSQSKKLNIQYVTDQVSREYTITDLTTTTLTYEYFNERTNTFTYTKVKPAWYSFY